MIKFRLYVDNQKEQNWINKLSKEGWALKSFFLGFYKFERCEVREYIYQIDLMPKRTMQQEYFEFMEETGVEVVCRWFYWVYLRKKTSDGEFKLYSDNESLKAHYESIIKFYRPAMYLELIAAFLQLPGIFVCSSIFNLFSFTLLLFLFLAIYKNIKTLENKIEIL